VPPEDDFVRWSRLGPIAVVVFFLLIVGVVVALVLS